MKLLNLELIFNVCKTIDISTSRYNYDEKLETTRELMNVVLTFNPVSRLLVLLYCYQDKIPNPPAPIPCLFSILDVLNLLAKELMAHNNKNYKYGKWRYSMDNLAKLKAWLDQLYSEITQEVEAKELDRNYLPLGYSFILESLKQTWIQLAPIANPFTEIDKACGFINGHLVTVIPSLHPNWVDEVKQNLRKEKRGKPKVKAAPSMVVFYIKEESKFEGEQVMQFQMSDFIDAKLDVDPNYELISVVSFNKEEVSFQIIDKVDGTWIGITNASEVIFTEILQFRRQWAFLMKTLLEWWEQ